MNYSMSAEFYTDPQVLLTERERIFARHWWLLGPLDPAIREQLGTRVQAALVVLWDRMGTENDAKAQGSAD